MENIATPQVFDQQNQILVHIPAPMQITPPNQMLPTPPVSYQTTQNPDKILLPRNIFDKPPENGTPPPEKQSVSHMQIDTKIWRKLFSFSIIAVPLFTLFAAHECSSIGYFLSTSLRCANNEFSPISPVWSRLFLILFYYYVHQLNH